MSPEDELHVANNHIRYLQVALDRMENERDAALLRVSDLESNSLENHDGPGLLGRRWKED